MVMEIGWVYCLHEVSPLADSLTIARQLGITSRFAV